MEVFVDWFESQFTYIQSAYSAEYGGEYVQTVINWYRLKAFLVIFFIVIVFILVLTVTAILYFYGKRKTRKNVEDLDKKIQSYMTRDLEMEEVFPAPYTEVGSPYAADQDRYDPEGGISEAGGSEEK